MIKMKLQILLLIIVTFATVCNSQVRNDTKHKGIIFKDWIFDLDDLKISSEKDTTKLNIVWNINNEKAENNVIEPYSKVIIKDDEEREFEIGLADTIKKDGTKNYIIKLKNKKTGELAWTYFDFPSYWFGRTIQLIVADNKVIIAAHSPIATGSYLLCLDIYSGKEMWKGDVKRLSVNHSKYSNSVYLKS